MQTISYRRDPVCAGTDTQHMTKNDHRGQIRKRGVWFENGPISHVTIQNHLPFGASLDPVNREPEPQWPEHRGNCLTEWILSVCKDAMENMWRL